MARNDEHDHQAAQQLVIELGMTREHAKALVQKAPPESVAELVKAHEKFAPHLVEFREQLHDFHHLHRGPRHL